MQNLFIKNMLDKKEEVLKQLKDWDKDQLFEIVDQVNNPKRFSLVLDSRYSLTVYLNPFVDKIETGIFDSYSCHHVPNDYLGYPKPPVKTICGMECKGEEYGVHLYENIEELKKEFVRLHDLMKIVQKN